MTRNFHISKSKVCHFNRSILVARMFHYENVLYILNNHINMHTIVLGDRGSIVAKVLSYKSEGLWFDPSWCQWIFH